MTVRPLGQLLATTTGYYIFLYLGIRLVHTENTLMYVIFATKYFDLVSIALSTG